MTEKGVLFGQTAAQQIAKTVREVARRTVNESPHRGRYNQRETSGIELCHGIIIEQCNATCSTYRVQRVHRYLKPVCDDDGSGA